MSQMETNMEDGQGIQDMPQVRTLECQSKLAVAERIDEYAVW